MQPVICNEDTVQPKEKPEKHINIDLFWIGISNLSQNTTFPDLQELVKPFGSVTKQYLITIMGSLSYRGFAYVHFKDQGDAQEAINVLNGYEFKNLILTASWAEPLEVSNILKLSRLKIFL